VVLQLGIRCYTNNFSLKNLHHVTKQIRETSLTWREGCRLKVFENRVMRRIFGPKRDEVGG
jgi:hypothetical protein